MYLVVIIALIFASQCGAEVVHTRDFNIRVGAGERSCFYETGKVGQTLEIYYQVLDGQHGDLDISLDVIDPTGDTFISNYKKPQNDIIKDLEKDGDYAFCLDNSHSLMNSKLVFFYLMMEDQSDGEAFVTDEEDDTAPKEELHWEGIDDDGATYTVSIEHFADCLSRTLKNVVNARHLLDIYAATKSRDANIVFEDTYVVLVWSATQIGVMCLVGLIQVYMIKSLFASPKYFQQIK